ncbi:electron transport complex subunit RsxC [Acetohalobium arabaticum]|uniref:Ion-translocating oxidoreductase complex subunit C n=1 Tax=Acetohalobium arabaticum (strain ATCC 49924 / DSM 5501 / Z-7288) TaxID=574087 RepID=D9QV17_ACEAZ|nr:electron transport complex subunit RsxC [Acetohalobium arabaticum]ADL12076.1 electron transport complex, RnfABCDGE type, C subunit [Acetohalobium arabaticum DSM 5501]
MEAKTFRQGIHPSYNKDATASKSLKNAELPEEVVIPLAQHIGAPCEPVVNVGDKVKVGQKIGDSDSFVSAPVHASISGEVTDISKVATGDGEKTLAVTIASDGQDTLHESVKPKGDLDTLSPQELRDIVQEAGIVGLGGATFPSHVKVSIPEDKNVDTVILNGAECEPYLTVDHRTMVEMSKEVVYGLKAIMKMSDAKQGYIGIEVNKPDAIEEMKKTVEDEENIEVISLEVKYPQGAERQLIDACIGREVPSGGLPLDAGVVVNNVGTAVAMTDAIKNGMPLVQRTVTVTGSGIQNPQNLVFRLGTKVEDLIEQCGGFKGEVGKVIMGGPMMGAAQHSTDIPATKGTSGILIFQEDEVEEYESSNCIRCARCVDVCPAFLMPVTLSKVAQVDMVEKLDDYNVMDCIECGSCSYVCPANIPLLHWIRLGKDKLAAEQRKNEE